MDLQKRPALRPLTETPLTLRAGHEIQDEKRPRLGLNTPLMVQTPHHLLSTPLMGAAPSTQAPGTGAGGDNIMDYLKARGGKIKELEEAVASWKAAHDKRDSELREARARLAVLEADLEVARAGGLADGHPATTGAGRGVAARAAAAAAAAGQPQFSAHLEALLDAELSKGLALEKELAEMRARVVGAEERAAATAAEAREARAAGERAVRDAAAREAGAARAAEISRGEAEERARKAELTARLEASQREAEEAAHKAAAQQLVEVRAAKAAADSEMVALRGQLAEARAAAKAAASMGGVPSSSSLSTSNLLQRLHVAEAALVAREEEVGVLRAQLASHATAHGGAHGAGAGGAAAAAAFGAAAAGAADGGTAAALAEAQAEVAAARAEAATWRDTLLPLVPGAAGVHNIAAALRTLSELSTALASRDAQLLEVRAAADEASARADTAAKQAADAAAALATARADATIALRKLGVVSAERDALRKALQDPLPGTDGGADSIGARLAAAQAASRAAAAETRALELSHAHDVLAEEVGRLSKSEGEARAAAAAAAARAEVAERRAAQLEKEADALARDVAGLQEKLGRGEFSRSSNTRVLHLRMNPEAEAHRAAKDGELGVLRAENGALKTALEAAEARAAAAEAAADVAAANASRGDGSTSTAATGDAKAVAPAPAAAAVEPGAASAAATGRSVGLLEAELAVARHRAAEADKAATRLREVFKERAAAFREAVAALFGYKVDMTSEATAARDAGAATTTYSLRPTHGAGPEEVLVFRYTKARGFELVPTAWTTGKLAREVDTFVTRFRCIPALTANLTMEGFQRATQT